MTKGFVKVGLVSAHKFFKEGDIFNCYCNVVVNNKKEKSISVSKLIKNEQEEESYFIEFNQEFYFDVEREKDKIEFHFYNDEQKIGENEIKIKHLQKLNPIQIGAKLKTKDGQEDDRKIFIFDIYYFPLDSFGLLLKELILRDIQFEDDEFSIFDPKIICGNDKKFMQRLTFSRWDRISKIAETKKLTADVFIGGIDPDDIRQGEIGDCYLLGALGVLSTQPRLVRNLIRPQRYSPNGIYEIKLFISGKWESILIDDYLPVNKKGKVIFGHSESIHENWVSLIEKGYSKFKGNYKNIESGSMREAMEQLTGGFGDILNLREDKRYNEKNKKRRKEIFNDLLKWKNNFALLATSTEFDLDFASTPKPNKLGIVPQHAYSILNVQEVDGHQLIKLRNPWGRFEWNGDFSDEDKINWTDSLKKKLNYENSDDGQFWMNMDDYYEQFKYLYLCRIPCDSFCKTLKGEWSLKYDNCGGHIRFIDTFFKNPQYQLIVPKIGPTRIYIGIKLENEPNEKDDNLSGICIYIFKNKSNDPLISLPTEDGCLAKSSLKKLYRDTVEITLYSSEYPYIIIPSHFYQDREDKFEITCYSSRECEFKEVLKKELYHFENILSFWSENSWGPHWRLDLFNTNPYYYLEFDDNSESINKIQLTLTIKVEDDKIPFFPYLLKNSFKDKFLKGKYLKEPHFLIWPSKGKEFYNSKGVFTCELDRNESPYILIMSSAIEINPSNFDIQLKSNHKIKIRKTPNCCLFSEPIKSFSNQTMKRKKLGKLFTSFPMDEKQEEKKEQMIKVSFLNKEKSKIQNRIIIEQEEDDDDEEVHDILNKLEEESTKNDLEILKLIPKYSKENIKNIIYPSNFPLRKYQYEILKTSLFYNTLICLPTGFGKTLIGFINLINFHLWYPNKKCIFLAPTKPLIVQHYNNFLKDFNFPKEKLILFTGSETTNSMIEEEKEKNIILKRKLEWKKNSIFFMTPHILENDLNEELKNEIIFICFDECHHATKQYSYCKIISKLSIQKEYNNLRIIGLTATPGKDFYQMNDIIKNLKISKIETLNEKDEIAGTNNISTKIISIEFSNSYLKMKIIIENLIKICLNQLYRDKLIHSSNVIDINIETLLQLAKKYYNDSSKSGILGIGISLYHILNSFLYFGLNEFESKIKDFEKKSLTSNPKRIFLKKYEWIEMKNYFNILKNDENDSVHPKLKKLNEIIENELNENINSKILIFTSIRESIENIFKFLNQENKKIKLLKLIGQQKSSTSKGQNQKEQIKNLKLFNDTNKFNCLISTCVGEEGLDIKDINLIICFDSSISMTRIIQRMGRTGRNNKSGECLFLSMKQTNEEKRIISNLEKRDDSFKNLKKFKFNFWNSKFDLNLPNDLKFNFDNLILNKNISNDFWNESKHEQIDLKKSMDQEFIEDDFDPMPPQNNDNNDTFNDLLVPSPKKSISFQSDEDDEINTIQNIQKESNDDEFFKNVFNSNFEKKRKFNSIFGCDSFGNKIMYYYSMNKQKKIESKKVELKCSPQNVDTSSDTFNCLFGCLDEQKNTLSFNTKNELDLHLDKYHDLFGENTTSNSDLTVSINQSLDDDPISPIQPVNRIMKQKIGYIDDEAEDEDGNDDDETLNHENLSSEKDQSFLTNGSISSDEETLNMKTVYVQSLMRSPSKNVNLPKFHSTFQKRFTKENLDLNKYLNMNDSTIINSDDDIDDCHSLSEEEE
eukprot:gene10187-2606_t